MTHTPGPFYAKNAGNDHQGLVIDETTGANIAVVYDRAHMHLLAAAPEILEACKAAYVYIEGNPALEQALKAAIAKAEGRG